MLVNVIWMIFCMNFYFLVSTSSKTYFYYIILVAMKVLHQILQVIFFEVPVNHQCYLNFATLENEVCLPRISAGLHFLRLSKI